MATHVLDALGRIKMGPNLDTRYLRIDCSNDPLMAGLEINAAMAVEPVLILQSTDDNAANNVLEQQDSVGTVMSSLDKDGHMNAGSYTGPDRYAFMLA